MSNDAPPARNATVAIIGLGSLGAQLAFALQQVKTNFTILGHDREPGRARAALDRGAVDRALWNLIEAVEDADLTIVTEPLGHLLDTMSTIAPHLRAGTLLTDTASTKVAVLQRAEAVLPAGVSFIGGHPLVRRGTPDGGDAAPGQIFRQAVYCLVPLPSASESALQVLTNLVTAIGARPYFVAAEEHDALMVGTTQMPVLLAAALIELLDASPSHRDLRRLTDAADLEVLGLPDDRREEVAEAIRANPAGLAPWLDQLLVVLGGLRDGLTSGHAGEVDALLTAAERIRLTWQVPMDESTTAAGFDALEDSGGLRDILFGRIGRPPDRRGT